MKGKKPISMEEFISRFCGENRLSEDIPLDIWECCVHLKEIVYAHNHPFPFNPSDWTAVYYFHKRLN